MTTPGEIEAVLRAVPERCAFCHKVVRDRPAKCSSNDGYDHKDRPDWPAMAALVDGDTAALLRELYAEMVNQFALYFTTDDVSMVSTGGLRDLEKAFEYFKLPDPCTLVHFRAALAGPQEPTA